MFGDAMFTYIVKDVVARVLRPEAASLLAAFLGEASFLAAPCLATCLVADSCNSSAKVS